MKLDSNLLQLVFEASETNRDLKRRLGRSEHENRSLRDALERLSLEKETLASVDPLTGAATRGHMMERLETLIERSAQSSRPLSLLILDLDRFKHVNDTLGHQAGDRLLRDLVDVFMSNVRTNDVVARYGGEEFVVVLPASDLEQSTRVGEGLRRAVLRFGRRQKRSYPGCTISVSLGVAQHIPGESAEALIGRADAALYRAKGRGRNRVVPAA